MNKISKKIVAIVTMMMFVISLVPFAAFAATPESTDPASAAASEFVLLENGSEVSEVTVDSNDEVTVKFVVKDVKGKTTNQDLAVRLWATDKQGNITDAMVKASGNTMQNPSSSEIKNTFYADVNNDDAYVFTFSRPGTYTLHATEQGTGVTTADQLGKLTKLIGENKVNVEAPVTTAAKVAFYGYSGVALTKVGNNDKVVELDLTNATQKGSFEFNGVDSYVIQGYAYQEDGSRATNTTFDLSTNKSDVVILAKDSVTTDDNGFFSFTFKMKGEINANLFVENADVAYTINIVTNGASAEDIKTVEDGGYVLAGTDSHWSADYATFTDAVEFVITDKKGDVYTGSIAKEPAASEADVDGKKHVDYLSIANKPVKSTLTADDIVLASNNKNGYTLKYTGTTIGEAQKDLIPGEYTVELALLSGENATATFNVAKFGTIEDLAVKMEAKKIGAAKGDYQVIDDEIMLGQDLRVTAQYVDANGLKIDADTTSIEYGVDGKAVVKAYDKNQYQIAANTIANESLIGTTIYVKAFDSKAKKFVEKELTVVDAYNTYTLAFDPVQGNVNKDNKVTVSVVDADGEVATKVSGGAVYAYVADQSNKDAKVTVDTTATVSNGKVTIKVFSDKETTADIVVAVKNGTALYGKTLSYTFGEEDINANTSVVMTIGSSDMVVNNEVVNMEDAAPYVADNRTFVPFRALGEVLGAEVEWVEADKTVTYTLGKTEVVMTIGEETYTINGEEKTMDVAPVIKDSRTYVPVRFVGEALGFKVTALYAADGTTASVVFQK